MTAAKRSSATASAKGRKAAPAKAAPTRATAAKSTPSRAKTAVPAVAPRAKAAPATKPAKAAAARTAPAKTAPAKTAPAKTVPAAKPTAVAPLKVAAKSSHKAAPGKPGRKGRGDASSEANLHKRVDSERIAQHIAAFEKSGGRVEKLGITRVLQRVDEAPTAAPAQAVKTGGRKR